MVLVELLFAKYVGAAFHLHLPSVDVQLADAILQLKLSVCMAESPDRNGTSR